MKIAACQLPDVYKDTRRALSLIRRYAVTAENRGASLLCFPECFYCGYQVDSVLADQYAIRTDSTEFQQLLDCVSDLNIAVVVGFMERQDDALYNSAAFIARGELRGVHRKIRLLGVEENLFSAGDGCQLFEIDGLRFGINICNDLNDDGLATALADAGACALICPTNNMLPQQIASRWKHLHNPIRSQRAHSNKVWIVTADVTGSRANNISYGTSSIIEPTGRIVQCQPSFSTGVITADIDLPPHVGD